MLRMHTPARDAACILALGRHGKQCSQSRDAARPNTHRCPVVLVPVAQRDLCRRHERLSLHHGPCGLSSRFSGLRLVWTLNCWTVTTRASGGRPETWTERACGRLPAMGCG